MMMMMMMLMMMTMMMQSLKEEEQEQEQEEEQEESGWTQYLCGSTTTITTSGTSIRTSAGTAHDEDHVNSGTSQHLNCGPKVPIALSNHAGYGYGYGSTKRSDMYMSAGTREEEGGRAQNVTQKDAAFSASSSSWASSEEEEEEEALHSLAFRPFYLELDEHLVEQARALLVADATTSARARARARPRHHGLTSPQTWPLKSSIARKWHPCDYHHIGRSNSTTCSPYPLAISPSSSSSSSIISDASSPSNSKRQRKLIARPTPPPPPPVIADSSSPMVLQNM